MRIAMFSWEALGAVAVGGVAVHASRLASALARRGHTVRLFTRLGDGQRPVETMDGFVLQRCPWDRCRNFVDEIAALGHSMAHYYREAVERDGPFDIVHCHDWLTAGAGFAARDLSPAKLAMTFHSTEWSRTGAWPSEGDSARIAAIEAQAVAAADTVVAVSYAVRRRLEWQFHVPDWKTAVIHHGIDLGPYDAPLRDAKSVKGELGLDKSAPIALFSGRFVRRTGCDLAMAAAKRVIYWRPDAKFIFAGDGVQLNSLRKNAHQINPSAFIFTGPRRGSGLVDLFRCCDVVLSPSREDLYGRSTLSGWAAGKPVIAVQAGVPEEIIINGANGWLVEPSDEAFSQAVLEAFANPERRNWLGRNGRVAVETAFTWDAVAEKTLAAYGRRERTSG